MAVCGELDAAFCKMFAQSWSAARQAAVKLEAIVLILEDTRWSGSIAHDADVVVAGSFSGTLHARRVFVLSGGRLSGKIVCRSIAIGGYVEGQIHCERVLLASASAVVDGGVQYRNLSVAAGSILKVGLCRTGQAVRLSARLFQQISDRVTLACIRWDLAKLSAGKLGGLRPPALMEPLLLMCSRFDTAGVGLDQSVNRVAGAP